MSKRGYRRSFIFGNKKPSKFIEVIYKIVVVFLWAFIYASIFGIIAGIISRYSNELVNKFIMSFLPLVLILAVYTMKKIFKDDFIGSIKLNEYRNIVLSIFLSIFVVFLIYFVFILVYKVNIFVLNSNLGLEFFIDILSNIIYSLGILFIYIGYVYELIKRNYGVFKAIIFTSLIYTIFYVVNEGTSALFIPLINSFLKMILYILIYELSGTLIASFSNLAIYYILERNILSLSYKEVLVGESLITMFDSSNELLAFKYGADDLIISLVIFLVVDIFLFLKLRKGENGK